MPDLGRTMIIKRRTTFKVGVLVGAAAMYLLDPENGQQRRRRLRQRLLDAPRAISAFIAAARGEVVEAGERLEDVRGDLDRLLSEGGELTEAGQAGADTGTRSHPLG